MYESAAKKPKSSRGCSLQGNKYPGSIIQAVPTVLLTAFSLHVPYGIGASMRHGGIAILGHIESCHLPLIFKICHRFFEESSKVSIYPVN
jgi:hypothetical protein